MTRDEIIQLVRSEVARALLQATEAIAGRGEGRRDRPMRLAGDTDVHEASADVQHDVAEAIAALSTTDDTIERKAIERLKRMRALPPKPKRPRAPKEKPAP